LFFGTDVFVLVLVLYDLASRGRVHPATLWGGALVGGFNPLLYCVLSGTPVWLSLADALLFFGETRLPAELAPAVTST
jgi:hypothetical protein